MNELQQVLLVFSVLVIAGLYFFSKKRQKRSSSEEGESTATRSQHTEPKQSIEPSLQNPSSYTAEEVDEMDVNQGRLAFGEDFEVHATQIQPKISESEIETVGTYTQKPATHHVLEVEELYSVEEVGPSVDDLPKPNFGIPEDNKPAAMQTASKMNREHQVFALMVLSTGGSGQEFRMDAVNQALLGVGTTLSKNQIYVTTDSQGSEIIRVANVMEPGHFPTENLPSHSTPGIALILELPTSVRAPAAMHDLIMMARKVSQRLNGRLYSMERQLIKESDLQAMRDAAVHYESEPL